MRVTANFTFFFGEADFLSNWYAKAPFTEDGITFRTNEHYMMYHKAILFGDTEIAKKILSIINPSEAKKLGREVKGFDGRIWGMHCDQIVENGATLKFVQNPFILQMLFDTEGTELVEASPYDRIWGIGLGAYDPRALDPTKWLGQNKLGIALTNVRTKLLSQR